MHDARRFIDQVPLREHQEQDDAQLEKQARDIVEGKKRVKRRGFDLGSDDSGSEDDDADRRRRKSIKKPRFGDGRLEGIGSSSIICPLPKAPPAKMFSAGGDVDTSAFLRTYNNSLEETETIFTVDEDSQMAERDGEEDDDDDEEPTETISTREIEAQVRKVAKEKVEFRVSASRNDGQRLT